MFGDFLLSEYLQIDISTFRNQNESSFYFRWLRIPFLEGSEFLWTVFSFTFINNQPKQMVIFKSLPILSFHIHTCILRKYSHLYTCILRKYYFFMILVIPSYSSLGFINFSLFLIFSITVFHLHNLSFTGFIVVDHIRSRDMKIGEDRREMVEALLWSFSFTSLL